MKFKSKVETTTLNVVGKEEQKSWVDVAFIQAGVFICVPSLLLGGLLVTSMSLTNAIISGVLGYIISIIITSFTGIIGSDLHVPTCVVAKSSFGTAGVRFLLSVIFTVASIGWFAVQNEVCGNSFVSFMKYYDISIPANVSMVFWGLVMLLTAVLGIDSLKWLNRIAVPLLFIIMLIGCISAINTYGTGALSNETENSMSILGGISLTASFLGVTMVCAPDFTRYQESRGGVVTASFVGILPAGMALLIIGAVLTKICGENDLAVIMGMIGLPLLGTLVLIFATWTTNTTNAYTAGINLTMILNANDNKRALLTGVGGLLGIVLALVGWLNDISSFFDWLGYLFLPAGGVIVADYFISRKARPENWSYSNGFNWAGIIGWVVGCVLSIVLTIDGTIFIGFAASGAVYAVLEKLLPKKAQYNINDELISNNEAEEELA